MKVQLLMLNDDNELVGLELVDLEVRPVHNDVLRARERWFTVKAVVQLCADAVVNPAFGACRLFALVESSGALDSAALTELLIPTQVEEAA